MSRSLTLSIVALAMIGLASAAAAAADDVPPIFAKLTFEEAKAKTKGAPTIMVAKATAVWCGPCKQMDKTTWRDEKVLKWFADSGAIAIVFDVDKDKELAKSLNIEAMPTMVAFRNGEAFDRVVGYQKADDLIVWLDGVKRGERAIDKLKAEAEKAGSNRAALSMEKRLELARMLTQAGEFDKAAEEYVWLWGNMVKHQPSMGGVRVSFMAMDMQRLAARHAAAKTRFTALRDELGERMKGAPIEREVVGDWIVLNEIIGDEDKTLEWFDRVKADAANAKQLEKLSYRLERLLEDRGRFADVGRLIQDPMATLRRSHELVRMSREQELPPELKDQAAELRKIDEDRFRRDAGKLYAAMLAAGREKEAADVAAEAIRLDSTAPMRIKIVETALMYKQPRPEQRPILEPAEKDQEAGEAARALHDKLDAALSGK